jgi:hypothetical protein
MVASSPVPLCWALVIWDMRYGVGPGPRYRDKEGGGGGSGGGMRFGCGISGNLKSRKTISALAFVRVRVRVRVWSWALRSAAQRLRDPTSALARLPLSSMKTTRNSAVQGATLIQTPVPAAAADSSLNHESLFRLHDLLTPTSKPALCPL